MLEFEYLENTKDERIEGLIVLKPNIFNDERGFFYESWNEKEFQKTHTLNFPESKFEKINEVIYSSIHCVLISFLSLMFLIR